jgi:hypothetical protein
MNERIKELSAQAWQYADNNSRDGDGTHGWLYRDKFAELLIRECMLLSILQSEAGYVSNYIAKHFGLDK